MYVEIVNPLSVVDETKHDIEIANKKIKSAEKDIRRVEDEIVKISKQLDSESNEKSIAYLRNENIYLRDKKKWLREDLRFLQTTNQRTSYDFANAASAAKYLRAQGLIPDTIPEAKEV